MANFQVQLPHVGESVTEAVIGKWLKQPGDPVEKYDPLVEVVTDKVSMEFPAPESGTLTAILAAEGETVAMGAVIAEMDVEGAAAQDGPAADAPRAADQPVDRIGTLIEGANVGPTGGVFRDTSMGDAGVATPRAASRAGVQAPAGGPRAPRAYSPVVMRLAQQHGIDLSAVAGTGRGGRVTKKDVLAAVEAGVGVGAAPTPGVPRADTGPGGEDRVVRISPVRRMIANRMSRSAREIPHAWSTVEVDVTGLVACRTARREAFRERHGVDLTFLPFTAYAVAQALRANPLVNSTWTDDGIKVLARINLGIAVAAPDGLVVPVLHDAERESVTGLALRLAPLVERARAGRLSLEDVQGGTFTLNNTGALGSVLGGPIINYPQAAIATTEAIVKRPVVLSGPDGDTIAIRSMMNLCMSFDHRVLDGAEAGAFMQSFKAGLESFDADTALE